MIDEYNFTNDLIENIQRKSTQQRIIILFQLIEIV